MQTLVYDPNELGRTLGPVEQVEVTTEGAAKAIQRVKQLLEGENYIYFGVRDIDRDGLSHWHIYWCLDFEDTAGDRNDLYRGVETYIRHCGGATLADHPKQEAVKYSAQPNTDTEPFGDDSDHGGPVHPCARYVAASLPHLGTVGEMTPREIRHGAVEWATPTRVYKGGNWDSLPSEFGSLRGQFGRC
jgi:hypothetical protein